MASPHARLARRRALSIATAAIGGAIGAAGCDATAPAPTPTAPARPAGPTSGGPAPAPSRPPRTANAIVQALYADARTLQPVLARDPASAAFAALHYDAPLLRRNPDTLEWDAREGTAAAVVVADGGREITYVLREGLRWSDGAPLTADDYRFTYRLMADPAIDHPYRPFYENVADVAAPDARTLVWSFREAFCPAIDYTVINPVPRHVFEGGDLARHPASARPTVGSGPFLLAGRDLGKSATFEANPAFYLGRPRADRFTIRLVADAAEGWASVAAGEADVAAIQASDADAAGSARGVTVIAHYPATSSWTYLGMNLRHPILEDRRVRQAVSHAVDRAAMVRDVRLGRARLIDTPFGRESWASTDMPAFGHDPAAARRLLDEAGWRADGLGARARAGARLGFALRFPTGNRERERVAAMAAADLRAVGIAIELVPENLPDLVARVTAARDYDMCILGWTVPVEPHGTREVWASDGARNGSGFADPRVDALYDDAVRVTGCDRGARSRAYAEVQRIVAAAVPCVFLFENESLAAVSDRIAVNRVTSLGFEYRTWEWSVRA